MRSEHPPLAPTSDEGLAWSWVDHLRSGGTTPWLDWRRDPAGHPDRAAVGVGGSGPSFLPGAQQLELLRRINHVGRPSAHLVRRVLEAGIPGRGALDLPLVGVGPLPPYGPRPVDPRGLPDPELVRVAAGLLAEDLAAVDLPEPRPAPVPRARRRRWRLVGDPWLADAARTELRRRGRPEGGRRPRVLVLGTDLATMLGHVWTARALVDPMPAWREWLAVLRRRRRLPARIDLPRVAATWAAHVGAHRVRIVLDPAQLPRLVGVRRPLPEPPRLSADAVDLASGVGAVLGLLVPSPVRERLLRQVLVPRLADAAGPPPEVPDIHLGWVEERARQMRKELLRHNYAVSGDLDALLPPLGSVRPAPTRTDAEVGNPGDRGVLTLAMTLLLEGLLLEEGAR